ncbi:Cell surface glyco 1 [Micractinium conductrix]|uniref:Cell surface glyco 1 n=1 Tax=Micractinium conductrix TaxID=554055 RepID=A0A2P6V2V5_9CHLO|nr:Cell surface glyco 1 [Micractinium conductrix]|eukprot:PSC68417.1 Cell surface glyco 1 [Micractinium conductrix]
MAYVPGGEHHAAPAGQARTLPLLLPLPLNANAGLAPGSAPLPLEAHTNSSSRSSLIVPFGVLLGIVSMAVACLLVWLVKRRVPSAAPPPRPAGGDEEHGAPCSLDEGEHLPYLPKLPVIIMLPDNKSLSFGWQLESAACDSPSAGDASSSSSASLCGLAGDGKPPTSPPATPVMPPQRRRRQHHAEEQWLAQAAQPQQVPPPLAAPRRRPPLISVVVLGPDHQPAQPGSLLVQHLAPLAQLPTSIQHAAPPAPPSASAVLPEAEAAAQQEPSAAAERLPARMPNFVRLERLLLQATEEAVPANASEAAHTMHAATAPLPTAPHGGSLGARDAAVMSMGVVVILLIVCFLAWRVNRVQQGACWDLLFMGWRDAACSGRSGSSRQGSGGSGAPSAAGHHA